MGGGKGSWPIAGTAVYMTSYPRTDEGREWENMPSCTQMAVSDS